MELDLKDVMPVNFLKKEKFTGSFHGMRFCMEKKTEEGQEEPCLMVTSWPEPYGYDATPDKEKESVEFSFDAEGIAKGVDWLNQQFESQKERWKAVSR